MISGLYFVAMKLCHDRGQPWTDPRTGVTYPPPPRRPDQCPVCGGHLTRRQDLGETVYCLRCALGRQG